MTVSHQLAGKRSSTQFMAEERAWLKQEEAEKVVEYCLELGCRDFPIGHHQLKEHVDAILQAWLKEKFPAGGVGRNWTDQCDNIVPAGRVEPYFHIGLNS